MQQVEWKKLLIVVALLLIVGSFANRYFDQRDKREPSVMSATASTPPLQVVSSSQSSEGVTEEQLTPQFAAKLKEYGASRISAKLEALARQAGVAYLQPKIVSESTVIQAQGKNIVLIRYQINSAARAVEALGISGSNLHRVMCTRESLEDISVSVGACAQKIKEIHGVTIGG